MAAVTAEAVVVFTEVVEEAVSMGAEVAVASTEAAALVEDILAAAQVRAGRPDRHSAAEVGISADVHPVRDARLTADVHSLAHPARAAWDLRATGPFREPVDREYLALRVEWLTDSGIRSAERGAESLRVAGEMRSVTARGIPLQARAVGR